MDLPEQKSLVCVRTLRNLYKFLNVKEWGRGCPGVLYIIYLIEEKNKKKLSTYPYSCSVKRAVKSGSCELC